MKKYHWIIPAFLALVILVFAGCLVPGTPTTTVPIPTASAPASQSTPPQVAMGDILSQIESSFEAIYSRVNPSVVNIQVLLPSQGISGVLPPDHPSVTPGQFSSALGSGFVWDSSGNIVTNNHVVDGASRITVTFSDGTIVDANMVGTDVDSDLAVIKVDSSAAQLKTVVLADSTQLKVGQFAIAIGNPFGLQGTMTVGFISGLGRLLPATENLLGPNYSIPDVIQTDAPINPGNSGGVLLDDTGKVIGVTQSIATTSGSSSGVGFAIPSAIVQQVVPALISEGSYIHPYLGVSVISLDPDISASMNLPPNQRGALVEEVTPGGPADQAGLRPSQNETTINGQQIPIGGDVIISYDGQTIRSSDDLVTFLARSGRVGQKVTLTILRDGQQLQLSVTLGARPVS